MEAVILCEKGEECGKNRCLSGDFSGNLLAGTGKGDAGLGLAI